jgi:hypothetical protein
LWRQTRFHPADRPPWWQRLRRPAFPTAPAGGTLTVHFGNVPVVFDILFYRGRSGDHIQLRRTRPPDVSRPASEFMARVLEQHSSSDGTIDL